MALTKVHNRLIEGAAVNVKDFGAVGDGVTDDTAAIQAAIDSLTDYAELFFPKGYYKVSESLNIVALNNVAVHLSVGAKLELTQASTYGHLIAFVQGSTYGGVDGSTISNVGIYGGGELVVPTSLTSDNAIGFERVKNGFCIGMVISQAGKKAITSQVNDPAGLLKNGNILIKDNRIGTTVGPAISVEQGHDGLVQITGNTIESSAGNAINIAATLSPATEITKVICSDNFVRATSGHGFYFYRVDDVVFGASNIVNSASLRGLNIDATDNVIVEGGIVYDAGREALRITNCTGSVYVTNFICKEASSSSSGTYNAFYFDGNTPNPVVTSCHIDGTTYQYAIFSTDNYRLSNSTLSTGTTGFLGSTFPYVFHCRFGSTEYGLDISARLAFANGDTTPDVSSGRLFSTANTGATSITNFDNGLEGQEITIVFNDTNTTIVDGASIKLAGSTNFTGTSGNDTITFVRTFGAWLEKCRSDN